MQQLIRLDEQLILSAKDVEVLSSYQFSVQMANHHLRRGEMEQFESYRTLHLLAKKQLGTLV